MKVNDMGISTLGEFIIVIGVVLVSVLFFLSSQKTVTQETELTRKMSVKSTTDRISNLMERIASGPPQAVHLIETAKCSVKVGDGILTVSRNGNRFSNSVPQNSVDVSLNDVFTIYVVKQNGQVMLMSEEPTCNFDSSCQPEECLSNCEDCYGPSSVCIGDGECNKAIDETCTNSPNDCVCNGGKECCPTHPDSDINSCLNITERRAKGKQCYCDNQCSGDLHCTPTHPNFGEFEKGCCPLDKGWNGEKCVSICSEGQYDRWSCGPHYNRYLDVCHPTVQSKVGKWIFEDPVLRSQVYNNNYDNAVRKIWKKSFEIYDGSYCFPACTWDNKPVNKLLDGSVGCGVCNHWAAVGTSLIRTLGVPEDRVYYLGYKIGLMMGHAVTGYKSDNGDWWIMDYTCCERLVKSSNWASCGICQCETPWFASNDHFEKEWKPNMFGGIC